jgi:hypothetical protein
MPDSYLHSISNNSDRLAYRRKLPFHKANFLQDLGVGFWAGTASAKKGAHRNALLTKNLSP